MYNKIDVLRINYITYNTIGIIRYLSLYERIMPFYSSPRESSANRSWEASSKMGN